MPVEGKDERARKESQRTWLLLGDIRDVRLVEPPLPADFLVGLRLRDHLLAIKVVRFRRQVVRMEVDLDVCYELTEG